MKTEARSRRRMFRKGSTLPVQCAWCKTYRSEQDREFGEAHPDKVSHGICDACKERYLGEDVA